MNNIETAIADFEKESLSGVKAGIDMIGQVVSELATDLDACKAVETDVKRLDDMAKNFKSPWSFAYHVGKDLLVDGTDIYAEITASLDAYDTADYHTFGVDVGKALSLVLVGEDDNGFDDPCEVPTGVTWGAGCRMQELCGTGCAAGACLWSWPSSDPAGMDSDQTACACNECISTSAYFLH